MEFKLKIIPPTVPAQEHRVAVVKGRPVFYDSKKLKETRKLFETLLKGQAPETPLEGPVGLAVEWRFLTKSHQCCAPKCSAMKITRISSAPAEGHQQRL